MSWTGESAAYTPSDETFGQVSLGAYKGTTKIIVSEELLQDGVRPRGVPRREFGERLGVCRTRRSSRATGRQADGHPADGRHRVEPRRGLHGRGRQLDVVQLHGAGVGDLHAAAAVPPWRVVHRQRQAARNLYLMLDTQNRPLWNVNVATTGPDTFLGYPIYTDPDMPAPAGNVSMAFGNWNRVYTVRRVRGLGIQRQNELHSDNGQVGFRAYERVDGKVTFPPAGIGVKHSAT
jgi:hypothetical protein